VLERNRNRLVSLLLPSLFLVASPLFAHHGDAGRYQDTLTTVTGKVVEYRLVNPHSVIVVEVVDDQGNSELWTGELGSPSELVNKWGWDKDTFKAGDTVTLIGRARKNGEPFMTLSENSKVIDAEGKERFGGNDADY
jgi:hypothetical protein